MTIEELIEEVNNSNMQQEAKSEIVEIFEQREYESTKCDNCETVAAAEKRANRLLNEMESLREEARDLESQKYDLEIRVDDARRHLDRVEDGYELDKAKRLLRR